MADIIRDIDVDEHYIITSEVAAAPSSEEALKGFAFGTTAGRILSPAELMTSKNSQPQSVLKQRAKRELEKKQPIVTSVTTPNEMIKDIAAEPKQIIQYVPQNISADSGNKLFAPMKQADILQKQISVLRMSLQKRDSDLMSAYRTINRLQNQFRYEQKIRVGTEQLAIQWNQALQRQRQITYQMTQMVMPGAKMSQGAKSVMGLSPAIEPIMDWTSEKTPSLTSKNKLMSNLNLRNKRGL